MTGGYTPNGTRGVGSHRILHLLPDLSVVEVRRILRLIRRMGERGYHYIVCYLFPRRETESVYAKRWERGQSLVWDAHRRVPGSDPGGFEIVDMRESR